MKSRINFNFTNQTKQKIPQGYFLLVLESFLKKMKIKNLVELNLILTNENEIRQLNYKYRKQNKPTDVLSFPIDITDSKQLKAKSQKLILGDIYIYPELIEKGELQKTFLHGLLHLVGYDHEIDQKKWDQIEKMF